MLKLWLAVLAAACVSGAAHAASHDRATFIKDQDLDGDGKVTRAEYIKGRADEFARIDANRDRSLSLTEYVDDFKTRVDQVVAGYPADKREAQKVIEVDQVPVRFKVIDTDHSGAMSVEEFDFGGWRIFNLHDTDRDTVVTRGEPLSQG